MFWENLDRRVYSNGTIVYKVRPVPWTSVPLLCSPIGNLQEGGVVEHGEFLVGSLADGGQVTLLPSLGGEQVGAKTKTQRQRQRKMEAKLPSLGENRYGHRESLKAKTGLLQNSAGGVIQSNCIFLIGGSDSPPFSEHEKTNCFRFSPRFSWSGFSL